MADVQTVAAVPTTGYELTVADHDPVRTTLRAAGEFDLAARDDLARALRQQEDAGRRIVRLDLSKVTFLDCSCLGVLVGAHHRFLALHGLLVLTGVSAAIARIIKITGLSETLFVAAADQDPFGPVLTAQLNRRPRVPQQHSPLVTSFESSPVSSDEVPLAGLFALPRQTDGSDTPARRPRPHDWRPAKGQ